jgi:DNA-binding MarR family transcriptional regulator
MGDSVTANPTDWGIHWRGIAESYAAAFSKADARVLETHLAVAGTGQAMLESLAGELAAAGFETTRPRFTILRLLYFAPENRLSQFEIAQAMGSSAANVTQLIGLLEKGGWVERVVNPTDRRFTFAQLTEHGHERCSRLIPSIMQFMADSVSVLTPQEQAQLRALLIKVRAGLQAMKDE